MPRKRGPMPEDFYGSFPTRLRDIMSEKNRTQQEVADAIKKTRQAVGYYADGTSSPDWKTIIKLAEYFQVSTDWLLGLTDFRRQENAQILAKDLGLSEHAIDVLQEHIERFGDKYLIQTVNLLIEQETLPPDGFTIPCYEGMSAEEYEELEREAEKVFERDCSNWENKEYTPILSDIEDFLSVERDSEKKYDLTKGGDILQKKRDSGFKGIRLNAIRTIPASDIAEKVLLSDIEARLKKLKDHQTTSEEK